jgi:hypothetical protein
MIHSAICKQVDFSEQSWHSTHFSEQSGHSTHFQVGGDNPKVEGQAFF